jgi:hypothetical protein
MYIQNTNQFRGYKLNSLFFFLVIKRRFHTSILIKSEFKPISKRQFETLEVMPILDILVRHDIFR